MKPTITKARFLSFFFSCNEDKKDYGMDMINELMKKGFISTNIEEVYLNAGYIPSYICENLTKEQLENEELEFKPSEVDLIG